MTISELVEKLTSIQKEHGDCPVFASIGGASSQFALANVSFAKKAGSAGEVPPHQDWLPERVVLTLRIPG